jgi:hypothetical protein
MTLFRCSTGEDWQAILADLWWQPEDGCVAGIDCGVGIPFNFLSFIFSRQTNSDNIFPAVRNYHDICDAKSLYASSCTIIRVK